MALERWSDRPQRWGPRPGTGTACLLGAAALLAFAARGGAQALPAAATPTVPIDRFEFSYGLAHPKLPPVADLGAIAVRLSRANGVWSAPTGAAGEPLVLGRVPAGSQFDAAALREVARDVVLWFNARGLSGVWVAFSDIEVASGGLADRRPEGDHAAHLVVWASQIAEVRTLARGGRFKPRDSIDNRKHHWIIVGSPLQPGAGPGQPGDLLREGVLEQYLADLSLQPGRRVEASVASSGEPGKVVLDYLVNEPTPWQIFAQVSNTGTESTGEWRGRLGFQDDQLTNHDDILNLDAISTPGGKTYGGFLSYKIPVLRPRELVLQVYGSYGDFVAEDSGLEDLAFVGKNALAGVALENLLRLPGGFTLDSAAGVEFKHYTVRTKINGATLVTGSSNFLVPYLSTTLGRDMRDGSFSLSLRVDSTVGSFANTNADNGISALGRTGADAEWTALTGTVSESVYLDRLFTRGEVLDPPVQELNFLLRGRDLLRGTRLIPQEEEPMGGLFTIRGYPNSVVSADEYVIGTVEYAFHVARLFRPSEPGTLLGRPFRWRRTTSHLAPDWDLILRAFYDGGYREIGKYTAPGSEPVAADQEPLIEKSLTMAGAGGGAEFDFKQSFSVRGDLGVALNELRDPSLPVGQQVVVPAGHLQAYMVATFAW